MSQRTTPRPTRPDRESRGVSEVVGVILLFGTVMAGVALILLTSSMAHDTMDQRNNLEQARSSMMEIDSRLGTLSFEQPSSAETTLTTDFPDNQGGTVTVIEGSTELEFRLNGDAACSATVSLGAIEYENDNDRSVIYEAGGIWQLTDGDIRMVQPPDFAFRDGTLTFDAEVIQGSYSETAEMTATRDTEASRSATEQFGEDLLTGPGGDRSTCMPREDLEIVVRSPYYQAWAEFLRDEMPDATIDVNHATQRVDVSLSESELASFDSDDDGTVDEEDNCQGDFNPDQTDTDGNGNGDVCDPDDDGDGVSDDNDNCMKVENPNQEDMDGDGLGNRCDEDKDGDGHKNWVDNCRNNYNPSQADLDGDGQGNACDWDLDGDGTWNPWNVPDDVDGDTCPRTPIPSGQSEHVDTDNGGRGNVCDPDDDGDGNPDEYDNCPRGANPNQNDEDGDGQGDICDPDLDGDGVPNGADNCLYTPNPHQDNEDTDGRGDACDPNSDDHDPGQSVPAANAPTDDDRDFRDLPDCDADETPDYEDRPGSGDATDVPDPDGDDDPGCYPSEIPNHSPPDPPAPSTSVINVQIDNIDISSDE